MREEFRGRAAIVTGASRGIGRAIALALGRAGMRVVAAARSKDALEGLVDEIKTEGGSAGAVPADVAREADIVSLFARTEAMFGPPSVLINNAGLGLYGPLADYSSSDLDRSIAVNLRGSYLCAREAMRAMIPLRRGYIINIASVVGFKGYANQSAYTATKHGVVGMTKSLAGEAQEYGIRVSVVNPGGVDTEMVRQSRPDLDPSELLQPSDVAQSVLFLLSLSDRAAIDEIYLRRRSGTPF